ncbi:hypothetical protein GCM10009603_50660 [Nocardiopsis exhalans]
MREWVWVLHGFDRDSGKYRERHRLFELSDDDAAYYVGLPDLGARIFMTLPKIPSPNSRTDSAWNSRLRK